MADEDIKIDETKKESNEEPMIELGCIIRINAPDNDDIHDKIYFIDYLDKNLLKLIEYETYKKLKLKIRNNQFTDESIQSISILERPKEKGYARQNNLLVDETISIVFGGDEPMIVNGKITNLEEDMIELKMYQDGEFTDNIYIDFAYKGIPLDLPIREIKPFIISKGEERLETIVEEQQPEAQKTEDDLDLEQLGIDMAKMTLGQEGVEETKEDDEWMSAREKAVVDDMEDFFEDIDEFDLQQDVETEELKERLNDIIIDTDNIIIGDLLGVVREEVFVSDDKKRFALDQQLSDMLDDVLASVPNEKRTDDKMNEIHTSIERFKELREKYSEFDDRGNPNNFKKKGFLHKPVVEKMKLLNTEVKWLIPIVKWIPRVDIAKAYTEENDSMVNYIDEETPVYQSEYLLKHKYRNNKIDGDDKYLSYNRQLNDLNIPYINPSNKEDVLYVGKTNTDMEAIVDNEGDFFMKKLSILKDDVEVKNAKYNMTKYLQGNKETRYEDIKKLFNPTTIEITPNETMTIKGFLKLNNRYVEKYNSKLINENILNKSVKNLSMTTFNNWEYLNDKKEIKTEIISDKKDYSIPKNYLSKSIAYYYKENEPYSETNADNNLSNFLNKIIPETKELLKIMKPAITDGVNMFNILSKLKGFHIDHHSLTYSQYMTLVEYMQENIDEYIKKVIQNTYSFNKYINLKNNNKTNHLVETIFEDNDYNDKLFDTVRTLYGLEGMEDTEIMQKVILMDNGKLFVNAMLLTDMELYQDQDIEEVMSTKMEQIETDLSNDRREDDCESSMINLAKRYDDIDDLEEDENKEIFFDKKYDETRYDIMNEFETFKETMMEEELFNVVNEHLIKIGITKDLERETAALILGKKKVLEGDYALLDMGDYDNKYYVRKNDKWIIDDDKSGKSIQDINFCNVKDKCLKIRDNCNSIEVNKNILKEKILGEISKEFYDNLNIDYANMKSLLENNLKRYSIELKNKTEIFEHKKYKVNQLYLDYMSDVNMDDIVISPHVELRDMVLSITDITVKYDKILLFIDNYCRSNNVEDENESPYWFYCTETDKPLLPTFFKDLALAFYNNTYESTLAELERTRGTLSNDGDKVVDKYSGYYIRDIVFSTEEGYDEMGFRVITRSVDNCKEDDVDKLMNLVDNNLAIKNIANEYKDERSRRIVNIVKTLDEKLKINSSKEYDFIIKYAKVLIINNLQSEEDYKLMVEDKLKRNEKVKKTYERLYEKMEMVAIISSYILVSQMSLKMLNSNVTFGSNCIRSFKGYPVYGNQDMSYLTYVCCASLNLRSKIRLWRTLPKTNKKKFRDTLQKFTMNIKVLIDQLLELREVEEKIESKKVWDMTNEIKESLPTEFNVRNWSNFLPPLNDVKIDKLKRLGKSFEPLLKKHISSRKKEQIALKYALKGKIIKYSLKLQELIQNVVTSENLLLITNSNVPYKENACCNDNENAYLYFAEKTPEFAQHNNYIKALCSLMHKYDKMKKASFLYIEKDTRFEETKMSSDFNEDTVYLSFMKYCLYNTGLDVPDEYKFLCPKNKSAYNLEDDLNTKIGIMKEEKQLYSNESLTDLLEIISKKHMRDMITNKEKVDDVGTLFKTLEYLQTIEVINESGNYNDFKQVTMRLYELLKTNNIYYSVKDKEGESVMRFENFIDNTTKSIADDIKNELKKLEYKTKDIRKITKMTDILLNEVGEDGKWKIVKGSDNVSKLEQSNLKLHEIVCDFIDRLMVLYPSCVINGEVSNDRVAVPKHWNLSQIHVRDVENINKSKMDLSKFYNNEGMKNLLTEIRNDSVNILMLKKNLAYVSNKSEDIFSILEADKVKKMCVFILMFIIKLHISMAETMEMGDGNYEEEDIMTDYVKRFNYKKNVTDYLLLCVDEFNLELKRLNYSNDDIVDKMNKMKRKEKKKITDEYKNMDKNEREVAKLKQNLKLGKWSVGLSTSMYIYNADRYEQERQEIINEFDGDKDIVTELYGEIYENPDLMEERMREEEINNEVYNMNLMAEDDDYGDRDGDEEFI